MKKEVRNTLLADHFFKTLSPYIVTVAEVEDVKDKQKPIRAPCNSACVR